MLEEAQIDFHAFLVFGRNVWNASKETPLVTIGLQIAMIVGEVQLERWIADNLVELTQRAILVLVEWML